MVKTNFFFSQSIIQIRSHLHSHTSNSFSFHKKKMFITKLLFLLATTSVVVNMARTSTHTSTFTKSSPKKGSPKKKDMTLIKLNKSKPMHHPNYVFKIMKHKADIEVICCERTPHDDAFIHPLLC